MTRKAHSSSIKVRVKLAQSSAHRVGQGLFNDSMQLGIDFGVLNSSRQ